MTLPNVTRESNSTRARAEHSIPYGTENIVRSSSFVYIGGSFSAKIAGFSGLASGSHYFNIKRVMEELVSRGHAVSSIKRSIINLSINSRSQSE